LFAFAAASRRLTGPILLALAVMLSACTIRPLYSTTASGSSLQAELASISVLPVDDRLSQIVRNELVADFNNGAAPANPAYEMSLVATAGGGGLNIIAPNNTASTIVRVTVRYTLIEIATGTVIKSGSALADTRYQQSNSAFANLRAREDAQQRAAIAAADQVRLEVSAALATQP
jgi:LPS-assembly lipoprotein